MYIMFAHTRTQQKNTHPNIHAHTQDIVSQVAHEAVCCIHVTLYRDNRQLRDTWDTDLEVSVLLQQYQPFPATGIDYDTT